MLLWCQQVIPNKASASLVLQDQVKDILEHNPQSHHRPAELATNPNAPRKVGLHDQEYHCSPEHCFQSVQDPVSFVALPAAESLDVLGGDLVCDEDEGFGALGLC